jgi:hypothetical protein
VKNLKRKIDKWFEINNTEIFVSKRKAKNIKEAWDKTFTKWYLLASGKDTYDQIETCGLCDLYYYLSCVGCPLRLKYASCLSTPMVKLDIAEKKGRKLGKYVLAMISFLCKRCRETQGGKIGS